MHTSCPEGCARSPTSSGGRGLPPAVPAQGGTDPPPRGRSSPSSATVDIGEVRFVGVEESEMEGALLLEKKEG